MSPLRTTPQNKARALLAQFGMRDAPVDVERLAAATGAQLRYQPFDGDDVSGLLYREDGHPAIIGVNSANSQVRQRFTIAHELGHLILHEGALIVDRSVRMNWRDTTSSMATDQEEIEANAFAAELLMPSNLILEHLRQEIRRALTSDDKLIASLAQTFRVSRQAMEFRLTNLGHLTPR